jgi:hypothetical protein
VHVPVDVAAIPVQMATPRGFEVPRHDGDAAVRHSPIAPDVEAAAAPPSASVEPSPAPIQVPRAPLDLPPVQMTLPADSELELVETRHRAAEPPEEAEAPRPRRVRPPRVVVADEPLQMVETRHESHDNPSV